MNVSSFISALQHEFYKALKCENQSDKAVKLFQLLLNGSGGLNYHTKFFKFEFNSNLVGKYGLHILYQYYKSNFMNLSAQDLNDFINNYLSALPNKPTESMFMDIIKLKMLIGDIDQACQLLEIETLLFPFCESFDLVGLLGVIQHSKWIDQVKKDCIEKEPDYSSIFMFIVEFTHLRYFKDAIYNLEKSLSLKISAKYVRIYIQLLSLSSQVDKIREILQDYVNECPRDFNAHEILFEYMQKDDKYYSIDDILKIARCLLTIDPTNARAFDLLLSEYEKSQKLNLLFELLVDRLEYPVNDVNLETSLWSKLANYANLYKNKSPREFELVWKKRLLLWDHLHLTDRSEKFREIVKKP